MFGSILLLCMYLDLEKLRDIQEVEILHFMHVARFGSKGDIQELEIRKCSTLIIHLLFANNIFIIFKLKQKNKQTNYYLLFFFLKIPKKHQETLDNFCGI